MIGCYDIVHVPTGCIVHFAGRHTTERIMQGIQGLDWNFTDPHRIPKETRDRASEVIMSANRWEARMAKRESIRTENMIVCY